MNNCRWMDGFLILHNLGFRLSENGPAVFSGRKRACRPHCESCNQWNGVCVRASPAPSRGTLKFCCSVVLRCYAVSVLYFVSVYKSLGWWGYFSFIFFLKKNYLLNDPITSSVLRLFAASLWMIEDTEIFWTISGHISKERHCTW
jgi:hypothetical protein